MVGQADGIDAEELAVRGLLPISLTLQLVEGVVPITDEVAKGWSALWALTPRCGRSSSDATRRETRRTMTPRTTMFEVR